MDININSSGDISFLRWTNNPIILKYDKVMKELKLHFKTKKLHKQLMHELQNLKWIHVNSYNKFEDIISNKFNNINNLLNKKVLKYEDHIKNTKNKMKRNISTKQKIINNKFDSCPICLIDKCESFGITYCGHNFCTNCIRKVLTTHFKCPICRSIIFPEDITFFNNSEYSFPFIEKNKENFIIHPIQNDNNDYLYIPPRSNAIIQNISENSTVINMRNISNNDDLIYQDYMDNTRLISLVSNIENNIRETYEKKLKSIINLFVSMIRSRRGGGLNNIVEIVNPNTIDDEN